MMLSKKALKRIQNAPDDLKSEALRIERERLKLKAKKTRERNLVDRLQTMRNLREQAIAMGATQKAREYQVEVRYLQRKLDALRGKR